MTSPIPTADSQPPPSWALPIAAGAAVTFAAEGFIHLLQTVLGPLCAFASCCLVEVPLVGVVPALIAVRRDPRLTAGQGFAVSLFAVGIGAVLFAALQTWGLLQAGTEELTAALRQSMRDLYAQIPASQRPSEAQLDEWTALFGSVALVVPVIRALITAVIAGLFGMLAVRFGRPTIAPPSQ